MRTFGKILLIIVALVAFTAVKSFALEKYGEEIINRQVTAIKDILANPQDFDGKLVTIEGKIATECPSGCWFYLKVADTNATMYVDIGKSGLAIPQYVGKKVLVEGTVVVKDGNVMIQGQGVEVL